MRPDRVASTLATRRKPAGPPAADVAARKGSIGRGSSRYAERVSDHLRRGESADLSRRRRATALTLLATGALAVAEAYQTGLLRRVPEPPLRWLDAERVDASGEAYHLFGTPDAALGIASFGATLVLHGAGPAERAETQPWIPLLAAVKTVGDASPRCPWCCPRRAVPGGRCGAGEPAPREASAGEASAVDLRASGAHRRSWCAAAAPGRRGRLVVRTGAGFPPLCWSLLDAGGGRAGFPGIRYAAGSDASAGPTARTARVEVRDGLRRR